MNKTLIKSEKEFIDLFLVKGDLAAWEVENLLNIEFAFMDGTYRNDWIKGIEIDDQQDIDESKYRTRENSIIPEFYPCMVVHWIENVDDRFGPVKFRMFDFVYESDFIK